MVGWTPWSAADAHVGLRFPCNGKAGPGGPAADEGVRPTASHVANFHATSLRWLCAYAPEFAAASLQEIFQLHTAQSFAEPQARV